MQIFVVVEVDEFEGGWVPTSSSGFLEASRVRLVSVACPVLRLDQSAYGPVGSVVGLW